MLAQALEVYRSADRPSERLAKPHVMMAVCVCPADSDAEAAFLRSSRPLAFARLLSGRPEKLPRPSRDIDQSIPAPVMDQVRQALSCSATGSAATVREQLSAQIDTFRPDELMVTGMNTARIRSFEIAAGVLTDLCDRATVA